MQIVLAPRPPIPPIYVIIIPKKRNMYSTSVMIRSLVVARGKKLDFIRWQTMVQESARIGIWQGRESSQLREPIGQGSECG